MKAARVHDYGQPVVVEEIDRPSMGGGQVLVAVKASAVNQVDWKIALGLLRDMIPQVMPLTLGCEFAGVVEEAAPGSKFSPGDRVFGYSHLTRNGTHAEFVRVEENEIAAMPEGMSFAQAASIPVAWFTALDGLTTHGGVETGQRVLVLGGAGGVGSFAVQLAKRLGAFVYATASAKNLERLKELGADVALDYGAADVAKEAAGVDVIFDAVGGAAAEAAAGALKPGGRFVSPAYAAVTGVDLRIYGIQPDGERLASTPVSDLHVFIDREYPLAEAAEALAYSQTGRARGKILLIP